MIFLSLGSNLGNRLDNLWNAISLIKKNCLKNIKCSIIIETEAIILENSPHDWNKTYLNMVIQGETDLSPHDLLYSIKSIEKKLGRPEEYEKWSPRIIDIDIILYNDLIIETENLTIPHLELKNRDFLKHLLALMGARPWVYESESFASNFLKSYVLEPRLIGVINITKDSFSDGGKFYNIEDAVDQVNKLEREGASIIEIGAQSTRPGATINPIESEYTKLDEVLNEISPIISDKKIQISIDTFHTSIALQLIKKYDISLINDVGGNFDDSSLRVIAESGIKFCLMHSLTIPPKKNVFIPSNIDPLDYIMGWGETSIEKLIKLGFALNNIILDPGIGFGKTTYQNIKILKNIEKLKNLGCPIMLGHSRKGYIESFSNSPNPSDRDIETIGISLAIGNKVDFLRVHNVKDHMKAMVANYLFSK